MKTTIKIHGLDVEFSDTPPTRAGAYWYTVQHEMVPSLMHVHQTESGELFVPGEGRLGHWRELGLWSTPLVPVTEAGDAWHEGFRAGNEVGADPGDYINSHARRVVEGVE